MSTPPIFLVAARRSGTTLLRLMLGSHPLLHWEHGWEFATQLISNQGKPPAASQLYKLKSTLGLMTDISDNYEDPMITYRRLLDDYANSLYKNTNKSIFGTTVHVAYDRLPYVFPDSKIIHLVRDPRDVAISAVKLGWDATYWSAGRHWRRAEEEWDKICIHVQLNSRLTVKYEDLVRQTETELRRICEFIGVSFTQRMFDYTKTTKYGYPDSSLVERWRGCITNRDTRYIEARAGVLLVRRGYQPESDQRLPTARERTCLYITNKIFRQYKRVRRDGITTVILEILVNRFCIYTLRKRLHLQKQKNREQQIKNLESGYSRNRANRIN